MLKKILLLFALAIPPLIWSTPCGAYVLPGPQLLELMTREMGKVDSLVISQRLVLANSRESGSSGSFREILSYRYPRSFRLESHSENYHRLFLVIDSETVVVAGNQRVPERENLWDRYTDLLFYRSGELLAERLRLTGIDVMVSSLGRFEGKPCYVLGAQYPDPASPQIWIEKDTFLPFRWLVPESFPGKRGQIVEFRFLDWQKKGKAWYPMHIQIMEGKSPGREIYVEGLEVNSTLDGSLFDIGILKKRYPVSVTSRPNPVEPVPQSDIQKTIEDFKKRYK